MIHPQRNRHPLTLVLAAALCTAGGALPAQDTADIILTNNGRRYRGVEVLELTNTAVRYRQGEAELELPARSLAEITWGRAPETWAMARAAADDGKYAEASNHYAEAAEQSDRAVFEAESRYLAAESLARSAGDDQAKAQEAVNLLEDWIAANPTGYRLPDALLWLGRAQVAAGEADTAQDTFTRLADDALANNWPPVWSARARFELAQAELAAGNHAAARTTFRGAISAAESASRGDRPSPELVTLEAQANVGIGESMVSEGNFEQALNYFRDLAGRADSDAIRAAARAGEGEALFLQAAEAGDPSQLRAAQIALAKANLLDSTASDTTAKALYYSGRVLLALGPDHESSSYKQRAASYFESVVKHFGDTAWAARAADALSE